MPITVLRTVAGTARADTDIAIALAVQASEMGRRCKAVTDEPVLLGLGISNGAQAVEAAAFADGVIVGSALVARVMRGGPDAAYDFVSALREALDQ